MFLSDTSWECKQCEQLGQVYSSQMVFTSLICVCKILNIKLMKKQKTQETSGEAIKNSTS